MEGHSQEQSLTLPPHPHKLAAFTASEPPRLIAENLKVEGCDPSDHLLRAAANGLEADPAGAIAVFRRIRRRKWLRGTEGDFRRPGCYHDPLVPHSSSQVGRVDYNGGGPPGEPVIRDCPASVTAGLGLDLNWLIECFRPVPGATK